MGQSFQKQTSEALYPKVLWNRPVAARTAGSLLILSGHSGDLNTPQTTYAAATAAGAGQCRIVMPDKVRKLLGDLPMMEYVASSPSGSLGKASLGLLMELAQDSDAVLIGGGLSQNSETTMVIERLIQDYDRPIIVSDDALLLMKHQLKALTSRPNVLIITDMVGLIKASGPLEIPVHIRRDGGLTNRVEIVQEYLSAAKASYATVGPEIIVGVGTQLSVTPYDVETASIPGLAAGVLATFWMQNQARPFEGLTTGAYVLANADKQSEVKTAAALAKTVSRVVDQF